MDFENKVVLVSGGTSGIGKNVAINFSNKGATVIIFGRREKEGLEVEYELKAKNKHSKFFKCDITNEESMGIIFNNIMSLYHKLDIAVNCAGIEGNWKKIDEMEYDDFFKVINTNLIGSFICLKNQITQMKKNKSGCIINISSISGLLGFPNGCHYVASKHGILGLTKGLALEVAEYGIRINAICPGAVKTDMLDRILDDKGQLHFANKHPLGRIASPNEISELIMFLASNKSSFITGQSIPIDGGFTIK